MARDKILGNWYMHCKKKFAESLVSDFPARDGKTANLFLQCGTHRRNHTQYAAKLKYCTDQRASDL